VLVPNVQVEFSLRRGALPGALLHGGCAQLFGRQHFILFQRTAPASAHQGGNGQYQVNGDMLAEISSELHDGPFPDLSKETS